MLAAMDCAATTSGCWPPSKQWGPASRPTSAADTGIDRSDVTAALAELESRGLIARKDRPRTQASQDRQPHSQRRETLLRLDGVIEQIQQDVLAPLAEAQRRQFINRLSRLT